jgi:hypothetical protein
VGLSRTREVLDVAFTQAELNEVIEIGEGRIAYNTLLRALDADPGFADTLERALAEDNGAGGLMEMTVTAHKQSAADPTWPHALRSALAVTFRRDDDGNLVFRGTRTHLAVVAERAAGPDLAALTDMLGQLEPTHALPRV